MKRILGLLNRINFFGILLEAVSMAIIIIVFSFALGHIRFNVIITVPNVQLQETEDCPEIETAETVDSNINL